MLEGSRDHWVAAGQSWSTDSPAPPVAANGLGAVATDIMATRAAMQSAIGDPGKLVLDVRSPLEYSGERFWPSGVTEGAGRSGHVPGAVSVPIDLMRTESGAWKAPRALQRIFDDAGVTKDTTVITYFTIGNRATQAWFALKYPARIPGRAGLLRLLG